MNTACVAIKYDVQLQECVEEDEFFEFLLSAENGGYEEHIILRTEGDEIFELCKSSIESMVDDPAIPPEHQKIAKKLLDMSDPDIDWIHIEFSEGWS